MSKIPQNRDNPWKVFFKNAGSARAVHLLFFCFFVFLFFKTVAAEAPTIWNIHTDPEILPESGYVSILADVNDTDGDLASVYVNVTYPGGNISREQMQSISNHTYRYRTYYDTIGTYQFFIQASDSSNTTTSDIYYFFILTNESFYNDNDVVVNVDVEAFCCGTIPLFYVHDKVIQNQSVVFLLFFENCGNLAETKEMEIAFYNLSNSTTPIMSAHGTGDPSGAIEPEEQALFWVVWKAAVPIGNYTAWSHVDYFSEISSYSMNVSDFSTFYNSSNCTDIINDTTTCLELERLSCFDTYGSNVSEASLEVNSSLYFYNSTHVVGLTAPNLTEVNENTSIRQGSVNLGGILYSVYSFNASSCDDYCLICLTTSTTINKTRDCAYSGQNIDFTNYNIQGTNADYSVVYFRSFTETCDYRRTDSVCSVTTNNTAFCNVSVSCWGEIEMSKNVEVVSFLGEVPEDQKRTETEQVPQIVTREEQVPEPEPQEVEVPVEVPVEQLPQTSGNLPQPGQSDVAVELDPIDKFIVGLQDGIIPSLLSIENIGGVDVSDLVIEPIVPAGWDSKSSLVSKLLVGETTNRTIFVKPPIDAQPDTYAIPVKILRNGTLLDIDYIWVKVEEAENKSILDMIEAPKSIILGLGETHVAPILLRNKGRVDLSEITARLENADDCLDRFYSSPMKELKIGSSGSLNLYITSKEKSTICQATLIVGSKEGAYAFSDIEIIVTPMQPSRALLSEAMYFEFFLFILLLAISALRRYRRLHHRQIGHLNMALYLVLMLVIIVLIYIILSLGYVAFPGIS